MLVLSRKVGEVIFVSDEIRIEVVAIHGNRVRLGIAAPKSFTINRAEVAEHNQKGSNHAENE